MEKFSWDENPTFNWDSSLLLMLLDNDMEEVVVE